MVNFFLGENSPNIYFCGCLALYFCRYLYYCVILSQIYLMHEVLKASFDLYNNFHLLRLGKRSASCCIVKNTKYCLHFFCCILIDLFGCGAS